MKADVTGGWEEVVVWITQILDEDEAHASHPTYCSPVWPSLEQILARIAADRKNVADYTAQMTFLDAQFSQYAYGYGSALNKVIYRLAVAHADRPGFREEWRHL